MKLLEYEAKTILRDFKIPVPKSLLVTKNSLPHLELPIVLKSQVPVGGRGKAGGIVKLDSQEDIKPATKRLFALPIGGFLPSAILAEQAVHIAHEYYLSVIIDRETASIQLMAHTSGGMEVEDNPDDSYLRLTLTRGDFNSIGEQLAEFYNLPQQTFVLQDLMQNLYRCFVENDATLIEINPLILTKENTMVAGDCKMVVDDAANFRHPEWNFEDKPSNTNFVTLDQNGNVATIANGAGLAMATVDAVTSFGMIPANFLDIGGGASSASVLEAFKKIMQYPSIKTIVINIFAGITRCDEVAKAIIEARQYIENLPPLCIRLAGTNVEEARELLLENNILLLPTLQACLVAAKAEVDRG